MESCTESGIRATQEVLEADSNSEPAIEVRIRFPGRGLDDLTLHIVVFPYSEL